MAKSRRTCYWTNLKDFWSSRPMSGEISNKENKVICHRIERAQKRALIYREIEQHYNT